MNFIEEFIKANTKVIEEKLPGILEKRAEKMLEDVVGDVFSHFSESNEALKKILQEKSGVAMSNLTLTNYSQLLVQTIEENATLRSLEISKVLKKSIDEIIGFEPMESIKLSDIVEKYKEAAMSNACSSDDYGQITIICAESKYKWVNVSMDLEKNTKENNCAISFTIHKGGDISSFRVQDFYKSGKKELSPSSLSRLNEFEKWLLRIINSGVKVVVDDLEFDTEWNRYED